MTEVPWPVEQLEARFMGDDIDPTYLHFKTPKGNAASILVTSGETHQQSDGRNVWHYDLGDGTITVSPSVHFVDEWHSPNPVTFKLVDKFQ